MNRMRLLTIVCLLAALDLISAAAPAATAAPVKAKSAAAAASILAIEGRELYGISARTSDDVWAVGFKNVDGTNAAYAQHWDGTVWRQVAMPGTSPAILKTVSAVSEDDVWAAGSRYPGIDNFPYLLHFDGATWRVASQPGSKVPGQLTSTAAIGPDDAYAVGFHTLMGGVERAIVEHWDGEKWSRLSVPNPLPGARIVRLTSVTAISARDVWAIGVAAHGGRSVRYALHWDGRAWTTTDLPEPGDDTVYTSISGSSPDDIWAVGHVIGQHVITEHWNGTAWSDVPFPHEADSLDDVTTLPNGDAWAVGQYVAGEHPAILSPLVGFWDGTSWTIQEAQGGAAHQSFLSAVGGSSPDDAWAVGHSGSKALIRHWDGTQWR